MSQRETAAAARRSRLRYVSDRAPGITRRRRGKGFDYRLPSGRPVRAGDRRRIESLAIPPAWERVWICPDASGHLQATGFDARGRKQYRYHPRWSEVRNAAKFGELGAFGRALPAIRARVRRDLAGKGVSRERVLACIVSILDETLVRIGNDEYARENDSYGLTTIRNDHARVQGDTILLQFRAKSGVKCSTSLRSSRAARIVRRCQELPGVELFCYVDAAGNTRDLGSGDVNAYLKEITGAPFTAKHFRTWGGSVIAADSLRAQGFPSGPLTQREARSRQLGAIDAAARELCNTRAVCRKYYVHPAVLQGDGDGKLRAAFDAASRSGAPAGLRLPERALLRLLDASPGNGRLHPRNQACPAPKPRTRRPSASVNGSTSRTPTRSRGASA